MRVSGGLISVRRAIWILAAIGLVLVTLTWPRGLLYWAPSGWIEGYLLRQTPLGSDEAAVRGWLALKGVLVDENGLPRVSPPYQLGPFINNDERLDPNFVFRWDEAVAVFRIPRAF